MKRKSQIRERKKEEMKRKKERDSMDGEKEMKTNRASKFRFFVAGEI